MPSTILLLGCTGPTGLTLARSVLARGHFVIGYGRSPDKLAALIQQYPGTFRAVKGAIDGESVEADLETALVAFSPEKKVDAVVSFLGPTESRWSGGYPFARFYERMIPVLRRNGVTRVWALSTLSKWVDGDVWSIGRTLSVGLITVIAPTAKAEMIAMADVFGSVGEEVEWTVFRVGFITDGEKGKVAAGPVGSPGFGLSISRAGLGSWLTEQIESGGKEWVGRMPYVCNVA